MERVWGGRRLETQLGKPLPAEVHIGESWELVDRPEAQSLVCDGDAKGLSLHDLWTDHREQVFGNVRDSARFPILAKLLDATETLSVQVHPPPSAAFELGGEPKTELWYVLDAEPEAELYAGFRDETTPEAFDRAIDEGCVAELLHRIPVQRGDMLFIPSGRCHAIGAGCLIVEIQQNSDTTYRVFDWGRTDRDGKARPLHIDASRKSINFNDRQPQLAAPGELLGCEDFSSQLWNLTAASADESVAATLFTVVDGAVTCQNKHFSRGEFFLLPAAASNRTITPCGANATLLRTKIPPA